jgi:hypothetical protein
MFDGYQDGNPVVLVAQFESPDGDHMALLERAWFTYNVGHEPEFGEPQVEAIQYRRRLNRSLSIGDVVQIDGAWYECCTMGWEHLNKPPRVVQESIYGTTCIEMQ